MKYLPLVLCSWLFAQSLLYIGFHSIYKRSNEPKLSSQWIEVVHSRNYLYILGSVFLLAYIALTDARSQVGDLYPEISVLVLTVLQHNIPNKLYFQSFVFWASTFRMAHFVLNDWDSVLLYAFVVSTVICLMMLLTDLSNDIYKLNPHSSEITQAAGYYTMLFHYRVNYTVLLALAVQPALSQYLWYTGVFPNPAVMSVFVVFSLYVPIVLIWNLVLMPKNKALHLVVPFQPMPVPTIVAS